MPYFLAPFIGWLTSGSLKFIINWFTFGSEAGQYIGNGGFPSTHTTTVSSAAFLIGFGEGWLSPAFGIAVAFLIIVIIDATSLRIDVGKQAAAINKLASSDEDESQLRERMGHSRIEITGGLLVGLIVSAVLYGLFHWWGWGM